MQWKDTDTLIDLIRWMPSRAAIPGRKDHAMEPKELAEIFTFAYEYTLTMKGNAARAADQYYNLGETTTAQAQERRIDSWEHKGAEIVQKAKDLNLPVELN